MNNMYISHSGILGMKWGIRRYQNKDGTLTEAGKRRYSKLQSEMETLSGAKRTSVNTSSHTSSKSAKKMVKSMSDEELRLAVTRLQQENTYIKLAGLDKVDKTAADYFNSFKDSLITDISKKASEAISKKIVDSVMGAGSSQNNNKGNKENKDNKDGKNNNNNNNNQKNNGKNENTLVKLIGANTDELKTRNTARDNAEKNKLNKERLELEKDRFKAEQKAIARANAKEDRAERKAARAERKAENDRIMAEYEAKKAARQAEKAAKKAAKIVNEVKDVPMKSVVNSDWDSWSNWYDEMESWYD